VKTIRPGLLLFFVQLVLVLSVAGKYLYERQTRPRVWTKATQFDPNLPLRGRYLALQLLLDACSLPQDAEHVIRPYSGSHSFWQWNVSLAAENGKIVPRVAPQGRETLTLFADRPCDRAALSNQELLFIPDRARVPLPLQPGQELWVEVTVPANGPPRPIQIALSSAAGFHPLKLE
jgi:hypothetical protein